MTSTTIKDAHTSNPSWVQTDQDEIAQPSAARIMTRLKLRHLTLLRNIALHGSLTRVAQETGVSQPAITKALAEIESLFGASLFIRSGRGLKPTAMGELAIDRKSTRLNSSH